MRTVPALSYLREYCWDAGFDTGALGGTVSLGISDWEPSFSLSTEVALNDESTLDISAFLRALDHWNRVLPGFPHIDRGAPRGGAIPIPLYLPFKHACLPQERVNLVVMNCRGQSRVRGNVKLVLAVYFF